MRYSTSVSNVDKSQPLNDPAEVELERIRENLRRTPAERLARHAILARQLIPLKDAKPRSKPDQDRAEP